MDGSSGVGARRGATSGTCRCVSWRRAAPHNITITNPLQFKMCVKRKQEKEEEPVISFAAAAAAAASPPLPQTLSPDLNDLKRNLSIYVYVCRVDLASVLQGFHSGYTLSFWDLVLDSFQLYTKKMEPFDHRNRNRRMAALLCLGKFIHFSSLPLQFSFTSSQRNK